MARFLLLFVFLTSACIVPKKKYETALGDISNLNTQVVSLEQELGNEKTKAQRLEANIAELESKIVDLDSLATSLELNNKDLGVKMSELQDKLVTLTAKSGEMKRQKAELESIVQDLASASAQAEAQAIEARTHLKELSVEKDRLKAEKEALELEAERLKKEKEELESTTTEYDSLVSSLKAEIESGRVTISELKGKVTVQLSDAILFPSGSYELKAEGAEALEKVASVLNQVQDREIRVEGHTDNVPVRSGAAYADNWALSALRASTVVSLLTKAGVEPSKLTAVGCGEFQPLQSNDTPEGKAANRRTEIHLAPKLETE